jgi:hypothetical protein
MELMHQLTPHLKQLRLSGILETLEARNQQAVDSKWTYGPAGAFEQIITVSRVITRVKSWFSTRLLDCYLKGSEIPNRNFLRGCARWSGCGNH